MPNNRRKSRAQLREELLHELTAAESFCVIGGPGQSRATEAVEALQRIKEGTYGVCVDCGITIPALRLRAKPEAIRCIRCQAEFEGVHGRFGGDGTTGYARSA